MPNSLSRSLAARSWGGSPFQAQSVGLRLPNRRVLSHLGADPRAPSPNAAAPEQGKADRNKN